MKKRNLFGIIFSTLLIAALAGCYSENKVSMQNLSTQYRNDQHYLHPEYTLYHLNDTISLLYFKIDEGELLYIRRNPSDSFTASVHILCKVTESYDADFLLDSNSVTLNFASTTNTKHEYAVGSIPLKLKAGNTHLLTVITSDLVSKKSETNYITADKTNFSSQGFMVRDASTGYVIFSRSIDSTVTYAISYNKPVTQFYVNYYKRDFPIAAPPFSTIDPKPFVYKPDSIFIIKTASSGIALITLKGEGFYHIQVDTLTHSGLTLYRFPKHYPQVREVYQMVAPLRYITTNDEFDRFNTAKNMKQAVDAFWINAAGNTKERARALIKNYYTRVQDANKFFTSYEEGWKTDRGMVYIIYGPPASIYRTSTSETWTYGEDRNFLTISFTFTKVNNPFSDNDYALERQQQYRNFWYNAVDIWREGRVY